MGGVSIGTGLLTVLLAVVFLSEQLRGIRRVADFNIAGSRMIEARQRAEAGGDPQMNSLILSWSHWNHFLSVVEPPAERRGLSSGGGRLKVPTKQPVKKKIKKWAAAGQLKKNPPIFDLSISDVSVMSGKSRPSASDPISQLRQASLQMEVQHPSDPVAVMTRNSLRHLRQRL